MSDAAVRAVLKRLGQTGITVHGFRSAFQDWAAERTSHSPEVMMLALAHAIDDQVDAAYRRGGLFEKRVALMQDWADFCGGAESRSATDAA